MTSKPPSPPSDGEGDVRVEGAEEPSAEELLLEILRLHRKLRRLREADTSDRGGGGGGGGGEGTTDLVIGDEVAVADELHWMTRSGAPMEQGWGSIPGAFRVGGRRDEHSYDDEPARGDGAVEPVGTVVPFGEFDEVLWEAELVPDPFRLPVRAIEMLVVHDATLIQQDQKTKTIAGLALVAVVAIALVLGLMLGLPGHPDKPDYDLVSVAELQEQFNESLSASTLDAIRRGGETPLSEAYRWLFSPLEVHPPLPKPEAASRMRHRFALAVLYLSLRQAANATSRGETGGARIGWLDPSVHECLWDGIGCATGDAEAIARCRDRWGIQQSVSCKLYPEPALESLDLAEEGLSGTIPEAIHLLLSAGLRRLHLQGNRLVGTVPASLGSLTTLRHLDLGHNQLQGPIPPSLGDLIHLRTLRLSENGLDGTIPQSVANLVGLMELDVSHNRLEGSIPREIGRMRSLEVFDASNNRLVGFIPSGISHLTSMVRLGLSGNSFRDAVVPHLSSMSSLQVLDISYEMLTGTIPTSLQPLSNLTSFTVSSPSWLSSSIPSELRRLENLPFATSLEMRHEIVWNKRSP